MAIIKNDIKEISIYRNENGFYLRVKSHSKRDMNYVAKSLVDLMQLMIKILRGEEIKDGE